MMRIGTLHRKKYLYFSKTVRFRSFPRLPNRRAVIKDLGKELIPMKHKLSISVSKDPQTGGILTCRNITVRDRLMRFLFGDRRRVTVLIPGDSVDEIAICETGKGGNGNGQSEADS